MSGVATGGFVTSGVWFGPAERPLLGWCTRPTERPTTSAVVIAPGFGYEYWSSHRTLRTLAEALAVRGHTVLRFDYDGAGDSSGERWDGGRVAAWRASLGHAVALLRAGGAERVTLVGLRLGATFALLDARALGADAVVAWVPVLSGKRFARELRLLATPVPRDERHPERDGAMVFAGSVLTAETVAELGRLDVEALADRPAPRVLVAARPEQPCDKLADKLRALGADVALETLPGMETALDTPTEDATVPAPIVARIADWIGDAPAAPRDRARGLEIAPRPSATITTSHGALVERVTEIGSPRLVAIRADRQGAAESGRAVVFLNSGSEPHIGPGRAWVDYTRALALAGYTTFRVDFSGWGESPDRGHAPGRPYDAHCVHEAVGVVEDLRAAGLREVTLAGLCAGAWVSMRAAQLVAVDRVIAINPQLYWQPGQPVEALLSTTRKRRAHERAREEAGGRDGSWSMLDAYGFLPPASQWLVRLRRRRTGVLMLFAESDDGLEYLRNRCRRRLGDELARGYLRVEELGDMDHQMYREWRRAAAIDVMTTFLASPSPPAPPSAADAPRSAPSASGSAVRTGYRRRRRFPGWPPSR